MSMWDSFGLPAREGENGGVKDDNGEELDDITNDMPYADEPEKEQEEPVEGENLQEEEEEQEKEEEESPEEFEKEEEQPEEDDEFSYKGFIDHLAESGVIKYDTEKEYEDSEDGVLEIFKDNAKLALEEEIDQYGEDFKRLLEVARAGGSPREAFEEFQESRYGSMDINDPDTRLDLLREYYETTGLDEELIEQKLNDLEDAGEDFQKKEAQIAQKYMNKLDERRKEDYVNQIKLQKEEEEQQKAEAVNSLKEMIETTEELNGFTISRDMQKRLFNHITKPVTKDGKTQLMINRTDPKKQLFAAYLDMIDYDVNKLDKKAMSKATTEIRKTIMGFKPKTPKGSSTAAPRPTKRIPRGPWDSRREIED
jgi:hypothetical protein